MLENENCFSLEDFIQTQELFGHHDENLRAVEEAFGVHIIVRGNELLVVGDGDIEGAKELLRRLITLIRKGYRLTPHEVRYSVKLVKEGQGMGLDEIYDDVIAVTARGKQIRAKTLGQKKYIDAIRKNSIVFGIGPAGTGKTYLAMTMAVNALKNKEVSRLILTRPAVEAGEKLGFLPGDLQEKVDPYLRPLYDALYDLIGVDAYQRYMERGIIEVAPLAYMRGRTLDDSFIILDEAQNTTPEQMKMFLTRLGFGSKAIITGDITQIDLPRGKFSGLEEARKVLADVPGIAFNYLTERDVVRHELVSRIITAYEKYEKERKAEEGNE